LPTHKRFEFIAKHYDFLKSLAFGDAIDRSQEHFLLDCPHSVSHLIIGGGSGILLKKVLTRCAPSKLTQVDRSKAMQKLSEESIESEDQSIDCQLLVSDIFDWDTKERFDVIHLPFILDLFSQKECVALLNKIDRLLLPSGQLIVSDFNPQKVKLKWLYPIYNWFTPTKNQSLPDFLSLLAQHKYIPLDVKYFKSQRIIALNMSRTDY